MDESLDGSRADPRAASEAFEAVAHEARTAVVLALAADEPLSFGALCGATDCDTSAGFAYHLRRLTGHFVRETAAGYELTRAGRAAATAIRSGAFERGGREGHSVVASGATVTVTPASRRRDPCASLGRTEWQRRRPESDAVAGFGDSRAS